jgi:hypothetical protein
MGTRQPASPSRDLHTNTVELAVVVPLDAKRHHYRTSPSLLKRDLTSPRTRSFLKNPQRYLNGLSSRFNNRKGANLFGLTVRRMAPAGNLPYAKLVDEDAFTPFARP